MRQILLQLLTFHLTPRVGKAFVSNVICQLWAAQTLDRLICTALPHGPWRSEMTQQVDQLSCRKSLCQCAACIVLAGPRDDRTLFANSDCDTVLASCALPRLHTELIQDMLLCRTPIFHGKPCEKQRKSMQLVAKRGWVSTILQKLMLPDTGRLTPLTA